jgi:hypothetical protein
VSFVQGSYLLKGPKGNLYQHYVQNHSVHGKLASDQPSCARQSWRIVLVLDVINTGRGQNRGVVCVDGISTPTLANTPFHEILQQDSANPAALYFDGPFCSGHFNPFKNFFQLWIWTMTITHPDVET